jgi:hypothetical protein
MVGVVADADLAIAEAARKTDKMRGRYILIVLDMVVGSWSCGTAIKLLQECRFPRTELVFKHENFT